MATSCSQSGPDPTGALGWGFGVGVVRRKTHIAESAGTHSWTGCMGTSWANDPVWTSTYTALP